MRKHKNNLLAVAICLIFFSLALFSSAGFDWNDLKYNGNGILADEIPHIGGGYYYLQTNRYFINPEHPPLAKDIAGLGIALLLHPKPAFPTITDVKDLPDDYSRPEYPFEHTNFPKTLEWQNNQAQLGVMFLFHPENDPGAIAFYARLAVILVNTLLLYLLYYFLTKIWNERAALLGLFFFAISQFSVAHGSFVVIDFMSALLIGLAVVIFAMYLKKYAEGKPAAVYFFLTSLFFALALLSKFSSIVLLPAAFLGGFLFVAVRKIPKGRKRISEIFKYFLSFAAIVLVSLLFVSIFYAFHTYKMENEILVQKINENYPEERLPAFGHDALEFMVYSNSLTKGLAGYANGAFMVVSRMDFSAQNTYFLGNVFGNDGAGGWYFPVLYFTKLSLGLHLFSFLALAVVIRTFFSERKNLKEKFLRFVSNPLSLLLFFLAYCYMVITFSSTFQIGLRHIMPVILAACLLTGKGVDGIWEKFVWAKVRIKHLFLGVAALMLVSLFASFPYYLEYYNLAGGGTEYGYYIATDSNYDWGGSDVRRLGKWMKNNNVTEIYTNMFADVPLKYYLGEGQKGYNILDGNMPPSGSYLAVSVFEYMANVHTFWNPPERKYTLLDKYRVARVGKTIFVYKMP